jgi:hypothetical protein
MNSKNLILLEILNNSKNFDIVFVSKNKINIFAIKKTLAVNCEYFKNMFFGKFNKKQSTINVNYDENIIYTVLKYIICGDIDYNYNNIIDILLLSREFCMLDLFDECKNIIINIDRCKCTPLQYLCKYSNIIRDDGLIHDLITSDLIYNPHLSKHRIQLPQEILKLYLTHRYTNEYSKIIFLNLYIEKYPNNKPMIDFIKSKIILKKINNADLVNSIVDVFKHLDKTAIQSFFLYTLQDEISIKDVDEDDDSVYLSSDYSDYLD